VTPSETSTKSAAGPRQMRPVNVIQHEDSGPTSRISEEAAEDTVELPPAYANIKK
jgi:hypothetical protein